MIEKPLPAIKAQDVISPANLLRWLLRIPDLLAKTQTFEVNFSPGSVPANGELVLTVAVAGVSIKDIITLNKPTNTTGLDVVMAWASAANQVSVKFRNHTGSSIVPATETYLILAVRR
jgi:hypothetical protein